MPLRRSSMTMKLSCAPLVCRNTWPASSPIRATASRKWQCACTSMVLIRLPLIITGRRWPTACCARAASRMKQLQKTMPAVAPARVRKSLRVLISIPPVVLLIDGDVGLLGEPAPGRKLARHQRPHLGGGGRARIAAHAFELALHLRHGNRSAQFAVEPVDDRLGQFCRTGEPGPGDHFKSGNALLFDR